MQFSLFKDIERDDHNPRVQFKPNKSVEHKQQLVIKISEQGDNFDGPYLPGFIPCHESFGRVDSDGGWGLNSEVLECVR